MNISLRRKPPPPVSGDINTRTRPRPIIVRFTSYRHRRDVFANKKLLSGTSIVVTEDLTKERMDVYRQDTRLFGRNKVWTLDDVIHYIDRDGVRGSTV